jgi:hypothetical protein
MELLDTAMNELHAKMRARVSLLYFMIVDFPSLWRCNVDVNCLSETYAVYGFFS